MKAPTRIYAGLGDQGRVDTSLKTVGGSQEGCGWKQGNVRANPRNLKSLTRRRHHVETEG